MASTSDCECTHAGYCARHRIEKTAGLVDQCRSNPRYRALWDRRIGMADDQIACRHLGLPVAKIDAKKIGCGCPEDTPIFACNHPDETLAIRRPRGWLGVEEDKISVAANMLIWPESDAAIPDRVSVRSCVGCPWRTNPRPIDEISFVSPWAVAITTAARRVARLAETLSSLLKAGWSPDEVTIFAEPDADVPDGWPCVRATTHLGGWRNWERALLQTLRDKPTANTIFMLQDDVVLSPNLKDMMAQVHLPANAGMFSPYTPTPYKPIDDSNVGPFRVYPNKFRGLSHFGMIGACSIMFPRSVAEQLATHEFVRQYSDNRWIDGVIGHVLHQMARTTYFHWPSLAQHVGDTSTLHGSATATAHRSAESFQGNVEAWQFLRHKPRRDPRIGVIGWLTASGLGRLNWMAANNLPVTRWLAPRHERFPYIAAHPDVDTWYCSSTSNIPKLRDFLAGLDLVLCFELPYYHELATIARRLNVRTAAVMMHECAPPACRGWPQTFDLLIHPNETCRDILSPALPRHNHRFIRWPIDTHEIPFRNRTTANVFFFGQGTGGGSDRKGGHVVLEAAKLTPNIPWLVRSQIVDRRMRIFEVEYHFSDNVEVRGQAQNPAELYVDGDVAVQPSRYEGMGLQLLEAMAAGMPLVTTDAGPMREYQPYRLIRATPRQTRVLRPTTAFDPDPAHLAEIVQELHGTDIAQASIEARDWVERNASWNSQGDAIRATLADVCFPR